MKTDHDYLEKLEGSITKYLKSADELKLALVNSYLEEENQVVKCEDIDESTLSEANIKILKLIDQSIADTKTML